MSKNTFYPCIPIYVYPRFLCDKYNTMKIQAIRDIIKKRKSVTSVTENFSVPRQSVPKWITRYRMYRELGLVPISPWPKPKKLPDGSIGFDVHNRMPHLRPAQIFFSKHLSESLLYEWVHYKTPLISKGVFEKVSSTYPPFTPYLLRRVHVLVLLSSGVPRWPLLWWGTSPRWR